MFCYIIISIYVVGSQPAGKMMIKRVHGVLWLTTTLKVVPRR